MKDLRVTIDSSFVLVEYGGQVGVEHARLATQQIDDAHGKKPVRLFVDAGAVKAYSTDARIHWTTWLKDHNKRGLLIEVHVRLSNGLVALAIQLVGAAIGTKLKGHSKDMTWNLALDEARRATTSVA